MGSNDVCWSSFTAFSPKKYDVFVSFRGDDTRNNFASHLINALCQKSIKTYVDYKIERGDEISQALTQAIEDSNISLIIFSENYASSTWCLEELTKILQCRMKQGQVVVPVFYKVDPSNVRNHTQEFTNHLDGQSVQKWKAALTEAANLAGWDSRTYRDESELIKDIVNDVLRKLYHKYPSELIGLVGVDENCKSIESLVEKVPIIGIWGMGGIGKTTVAKVVFAKLCSQYESCCFLENVREQSQKHGLNYLHDKLLFELLKDEYPHNSAVEVVGSKVLMRRLESKKKLIVLDDVNGFEQLEYLAREFVCLGAGSTVIITTRDKHLLIGRVNEIYKVKELNFQDALKLFSLNAFKDSNPQIGYKELSERAVVHTKGNPLALKVLGSLFHSRSIEMWESALSKLKKYPNVQIQNVLKLSYDGLDDAEKDIFLDVAFFFEGEDKDHVIRLLDACYLFATSGIEILQDKALITISKENKIQMHELIQEMGWEIVRQESIKDPGRRSRLRDTEEVCDVLKNNRGTDVIEGIMLDMSQIRELPLSADIFKKMVNLRLLKFYSPFNERACNVHLSMGLESLPHKLRYLQWNGYPLMSLPSTFCAEMLVELRLPHSHVKKLWDGLQDFVNLKEIDLIASTQLMELPDLSKATKLEILNISHCINLSNVHPSILSLDSLVDFVLYGCKKLKSLHLRSVKYIVLNGCFNLKEFSLTSGEINMLDLRGTAIETLDMSIGHLSKIDKIYVCQSLKNVPKDLPSLASLRELNLHSCRQLDMSNLHNLLGASHYVQKLILDECGNLYEVPSNIKHLSCLEYLSLRDCMRLQYIPQLPPSIGHLDVINCTSLKTVLPLMTSRQMGQNDISISFENCLKLDTHSQSNIMEYANFKLKQIANANVNSPHTLNKRGGAICLPGSKVPEWFETKTKTQASITVELPPPFHLLGFVFCVVLSQFQSNGKYEYHQIVCQWCLEDGRSVGYICRWYHKGITTLNSDHVYLWYEPACDKIIEAAKENRGNDDECNTDKLIVSFKFYVETHKLCEPKQIGLIGIKECGVCPINASEYCSFINHIELDMKTEHRAREITMEVGSSDQNIDEEERNDIKSQEQNKGKDSCYCLPGLLLKQFWGLVSKQ